MSYSLVNYSQRDPAWKSVKMGKSSETIGHVGCALTTVAMLVSGHGYPETPKTLNAKLKSRGGYVDAAIIWGAVTSIYPGIAFRNLLLCRDTPAPLSQINAAIAAGQPVLVEVDSSPKRGLQTHWMVLYAKKGKDYLMQDPWPHPTESGQEVKLMSRYSHGVTLKQSITAAVFYQAVQVGPGDSSETAPTRPASPDQPGTYVRIPVSVEAGLRLRAQPTTASATVAIEHPGADLRILEPVKVATPKLGVYGQWIHVADSQGREGYVAAWYVEKGKTVKGTSKPSKPKKKTVPKPVAEPKKESDALILYVSQSVGTSGLRLRKTSSMRGALVAVEKAGAALTVLEPASKAKPKIGKKGKWIHVSDTKRRKGYVAADYVELKGAKAPVDAPKPKKSTTKLTVTISEAASAGLRMRSKPTTNSSTLAILPATTKLTVLEGTDDMIGAHNKWFKVREPGGKEGYVAAWYVRN